jgi:ABC-2 type transport system ATP-binding protein
MRPEIEVKDLTRTYGDFTAVDRVNFSIHKGEIIGFLGPNGAGKTTTIKMIMGLLKITAGNVLVQGLDVRKNLRQIKPVLGYMSQKFSLYPLLTSLENIEFFAGVSGLSRREIQAKKLALAELIPGEILRKKVMDIPPGYRQQVALFSCLMPGPEIILLDEPTSGVDPETRRQFWMDIYKLKKNGKTILVTTHNLDEAEYADRLIILHQGRVVAKGKPAALLQEEQAADMEQLFKKVLGKHAAH